MKKILWRTSLLLSIVAIGCVMLAQDSSAPAKPKSSPPAGAGAMAMPTAAPEMTKLVKMMSGSWMVSEKIYPSPMMPNGGTGRGTATITPGPGGMSLIEKYHSSSSMSPNFNGYGTFWWEPKDQVYRGVWCDNMTPNGCDPSGTTKWDGENLVGTLQGEMNGKPMMTRFIYSDWKPNSFVMTMEMGPDANNLQKAMVVTYSKASGAAGTAGKGEKPTM